MGDGAVCVAYVHSSQVTHSWHQSILDLLAHDIEGEQRLVKGGFIASRYGTGEIVAARNQTVERFIEGEADWLLWTDTDMGFAADSLARLLASADPVERPIVGGLCFAWQEYASDGMGGWRAKPLPTLYRWVKDAEREGFAAWLDYPRDELLRVSATGSAFILVHRDALMKIGEAYGANWYTRVVNPTSQQLLGEDLSFCMKAGICGLPIYVDTRVKTTHQKTIWVAEEDYAWAR